MNKIINTLFYGVLTLFFVGLVLGQILVPIIANDVAQQFPEVNHLVVPYSMFGILTLICFQGALVMIGVVFKRANEDKFFTPSARMWIKLIAAIVAMGCFVPVAVGVHLLATVNAGGPGVMLGIIAASGTGVGVICLGILALRAFDLTSSEHHELEEVI